MLKSQESMLVYNKISPAWLFQNKVHNISTSISSFPPMRAHGYSNLKRKFDRALISRMCGTPLKPQSNKREREREREREKERERKRERERERERERKGERERERDIYNYIYIYIYKLLKILSR